MKYLLLTTSPFQLLNALIYGADDPKSYFCLVINENSYGSSELCQFEFISEIFNVNLIKINNTHWIEDYSEIKALIGSNMTV